MNKKKKVEFTSLVDCNLINILKEYCSLLKSHFNGSYKFLCTGCSYHLLSYHHKTTISYIEFDHPVCQFISHVIKETHCGGLYFGIVTSSYLNKILQVISIVNPKIHHSFIISHLDKIKSFVLLWLDEAKIRTEFRGTFLISLVKNSLNILGFHQNFVNILAICIVKATLLAVDESSQKFGHIIVKAIEGIDLCKVYSGVLYKVESLWIPRPKCSYSSPISILVFTESIVFNSDSSPSNISEFVTNLEGAEIKVIASQKLIDKKLMALLRRHNIYAMERFGEDMINSLIHLSGAFPISDQNLIKWDDVSTQIGIISGITLISILNQDYLLIQAVPSSVVTLFVSNRLFGVQDQVKVTLNQCIYTLFSFYKHPYLVPDDFDAWLVGRLKHHKDSDSLFMVLMNLLAESIEETSYSEKMIGLKKEVSHNCVYLLKKNSLSQAFLTIMNLLNVGLLVVKK